MPYKAVLIDSSDNPRALKYELDEGDPGLNEEQVKFRLNLGLAVRDARKISDVSIRKQFFNQLAALGKSALTRVGGDIQAAEIEFEEVCREIEESLTIDRNRLLYEVIRRSSPILIAGIGILIIYGLSFVTFDKLALALPAPGEAGLSIKALERTQNLIGALGFSFMGLYLGLIVSSMLRARGANGAEALEALHFHGFGVQLYNVYVAIILVVLVTLLGFDIVQIGIGGRLLNEFTQIPALGLLVGAVCAAGEASISQMILDTFEGPERRRVKN